MYEHIDVCICVQGTMEGESGIRIGEGMEPSDISGSDSCFPVPPRTHAQSGQTQGQVLARYDIPFQRVF